MPSLEHSGFAGALTLICEHNEEGAMGIVVSRPMNLTLGEVFQTLGMADARCAAEPVYVGGPVEVDRGFVLHTGEAVWKSTLRVSTEVLLTTSQDVIVALARDEGPGSALVALGYAGWGAGQLERELANNLWLICPASFEILFRVPVDQRMEAAVSGLGIRKSQLSDRAGHA